ncbi:MAG TPA: nucleotide exchange factor GrpE [Candidatus Aminicenantes bacterium]|nr:nucleotide exchange factor GrpE [Candidatus Aminicenantes bacterium]HRY65138.1 nucleotide exchange factor GrpE [Candidatus Aminicenantes bacterium]HRZ72394.1 nucleotide exchange factor GrpE [Candidatus Aminicenantes bacterium]
MTDEKDKGDDEIEFIPGPPADGEPQAAAPKPAPERPAVPEAKAAEESARPLKDKLKKKDAEIKALKQDLADLKEAHLRRLADMENLRKRFEREKGEFEQYALSGLLIELLGISDNFERALQSATAEGSDQTFREGVDLIFRMLQALLAKHGVRVIAPESRVFDPTIQQAMIVEESDQVAEPTVAEELQKGYMIHDRLLRAALVKVYVPKKGQ